MPTTAGTCVALLDSGAGRNDEMHRQSPSVIPVRMGIQFAWWKDHAFWKRGISGFRPAPE
ncbi:MAG: hypothetical protein CMJ62_16090 [Planctomycetaceae bacterium]|nr:hypothetical protein [Planctomycetaceae bacterium]